MSSGFGESGQDSVPLKSNKQVADLTLGSRLISSLHFLLGTASFEATNHIEAGISIKSRESMADAQAFQPGPLYLTGHGRGPLLRSQQQSCVKTPSLKQPLCWDPPLCSPCLWSRLRPTTPFHTGLPKANLRVPGIKKSSGGWGSLCFFLLIGNDPFVSPSRFMRICQCYLHVNQN